MPKVSAGTARGIRSSRIKVPRLGATDAVLSEHLEQVQTVAWFRKTFQGVRIFAIPNGGNRGIREASRFKAEGVSAGVPDLYVPEYRLWIEMKRSKGGRVSPEQHDWHLYLSAIGDQVMVCHGFEDAKRQIQEWMESLK